MQSWTRVLRDWAPEGRKPTEIHLVAVGEAAIPALHAAALEDDVYRTVTLRRMIPSWEHIVRASETFDQWVNVVHGALQHYDLPDLIELAGSGRVKRRRSSRRYGPPDRARSFGRRPEVPTRSTSGTSSLPCCTTESHHIAEGLTAVFEVVHSGRTALLPVIPVRDGQVCPDG